MTEKRMSIGEKVDNIVELTAADRVAIARRNCIRLVEAKGEAEFDRRTAESESIHDEVEDYFSMISARE